MEVSGPPLPPRYEIFCQHVARGSTLTEAAAESGYAPASARRRGSELYAREDIQRRIGLLISARQEAETARRDAYMERLQSLYDACVKNGEHRTAVRIVTLQLQLDGLDPASLNRRARTEQARKAREDELRDRLRAELRDELRAEIMDELVQAGRDEQMRAPAPEPTPDQDKAPQTWTNQDILPENPDLPDFDTVRQILEARRGAPKVVSRQPVLLES